MKKILIGSLFLIILMNGCGKASRQKFNKLQVGMTKAQVLKIMGTPYNKTALDKTEWLYYLTGNYLFCPENSCLTPVIIEDGKLKGWGYH